MPQASKAAGQIGDLRSLQRNHGDAVFALAVNAQPEGFHILIPPQDVMNGFPQSAGSLAVNDGHGFQMPHDGAGEERFHSRFPLPASPCPDIQPRLAAVWRPVTAVRTGFGAFFSWRPLVILNEPHLAGLGLHLQDTGSQLQKCRRCPRFHPLPGADAGDLH